MAPGPIRFMTMGCTLGLIFATELGAWWVVQNSVAEPLLIIGSVRLVQIIGILAVVVHVQQSLTPIGWSPSTWVLGLRNGALWSIAFGAVVVLAMGVVYLAGANPLHLVRSPLPVEPLQVLLFFIVGGLIAPLAEEICFRGVLYSYFRRWGVVAAILASTTIFVLLHSVQGFPVVQLIGGILFAISFEVSGNLMVPIVIHSTGNLAIFTLSLPVINS